MRRASLIWYYSATANAYTDVTYALGQGTAPITLLQHDKLYIAHEDWLSGLVLFISQTPVAPPTIITEEYDGLSDSWRAVAMQERIDQLPLGDLVSPVGFTFMSRGVLFWNDTPNLKTLRTAQPDFPEQTLPIADAEGYWLRLRNAGPVPLTIDRLLPRLYNTYAAYGDVASFLGIPEFTEEDDPTATSVRRHIHTAEDWLDYKTHRSWRPNLVLNERSALNIFGTTVRQSPVWFVTRAVLWNYTSMTDLFQGRGQDYFVSQNGNMLYFNSIGLGLMPIFGKLTSAYYRQQEPLEVDYVYGADFDTDTRSALVRDTVTKRVAAAICAMADWAPALLGNPEMSKPEKIEYYLTSAEKQAEDLTRVVLV